LGCALNCTVSPRLVVAEAAAVKRINQRCGVEILLSPDVLHELVQRTMSEDEAIHNWCLQGQIQISVSPDLH
jgi:hypothetical protein